MTKEAVATRYDTDGAFEQNHFESYRKKGSRKLGLEPQVEGPSPDKLTDLVLPQVANDLVFPVQEALRKMKPDLISEPLKAMEKVIIEEFEGSIQAAAVGDASPDIKVLQALSRVVLPR